MRSPTARWLLSTSRVRCFRSEAACSACALWRCAFHARSASLGFLALHACLCHLPSLFHLGAAHGVCPFRVCSRREPVSFRSGLALLSVARRVLAVGTLPSFLLFARDVDLPLPGAQGSYASASSGLVGIQAIAASLRCRRFVARRSHFCLRCRRLDAGDVAPASPAQVPTEVSCFLQLLRLTNLRSPDVGRPARMLARAWRLFDRFSAVASRGIAAGSCLLGVVPRPSRPDSRD